MNKSLEQTTPFDQYTRYKTFERIINFNRRKDQIFQILDVGGRGNLLATFLPDDKVFFLEPNDVSEGAKNFIRGDGTKLELGDDSFDWVVSADVFEHIPNNKKEDFVKEHFRVAKLGFILSAPFSNPEVKKAEREVNDFFKSVNKGKDHPWLGEHAELGLPKEKDIEEYISKLTKNYQKLGIFSLSIWPLILKSWDIAFKLPEDSRQKALDEINNWLNTEIYPIDLTLNTDDKYRKIYFAKKDGKLKDLEIKSFKQINPIIVQKKLNTALVKIAGEFSKDNTKLKKKLDKTQFKLEDFKEQKEHELQTLQTYVEGLEEKFRKLEQENIHLNIKLENFSRELQSLLNRRSVKLVLKTSENIRKLRELVGLV